MISKPTQISVHNPIFGPRNLGHYFGSMKDLVINQYDYETIIVIDDIAASFMNPRDQKYVHNRSLFVAQDFINSGLDCEVNYILFTSQIVPELMQLILYYSTIIDFKYCEYLHQHSFLGGLKLYQRKGIELANRPSIQELMYPQLAMPSLSLGLDIELFQGGEEIIGYTHIMEEIVTKLKVVYGIYKHSPIYEPARNKMVLGLDGRYMFQDNCIYLAENEDVIREKISRVKKKEVILDWANSMGTKDQLNDIESEFNFDLEKRRITDLLIDELSPFRNKNRTNKDILNIVSRSTYKIKEKLNASIECLQGILKMSLKF